MVLESLFSANTLEKRPLDMLILSIIVTLVCIYVSYMIFPQYAGIIMPLLVTVALAPVMFKVFFIEEECEREEAEHKIHKGFWDRHDETIIMFMLIFLGVFLSVFLVCLLAPESFVETVFSQEISSINAINPSTGAVTLSSGLLEIIALNNMKVLFFSFLLAFLIGTGVIFILSWNAAILAIYLASFIRQGLHNEFIMRSISIAPHAPVEIAAYILAGVAGGMISIGIVREKIGSKEFRLVFKDAMILLGLAVAAIIAGALLEVFI